jgi:hypothetical protein
MDFIQVVFDNLSETVSIVCIIGVVLIDTLLTSQGVSVFGLI